MSIRLGAYAVDVAAFRQVAEQPLWKTLLDIRDCSPEQEVHFPVGEDVPRRMYHVRPGQQIEYRDSSVYTPVPDSQAREIPFLQMPTGEYLTNSIAYWLKFLFMARHLVAGRPYVCTLTEGYRPWWVLSMLRSAKELLAEADYKQLRRYCAAMVAPFDYIGGPK